MFLTDLQMTPFDDSVLADVCDVLLALPPVNVRRRVSADEHVQHGQRALSRDHRRLLNLNGSRPKQLNYAIHLKNIEVLKKKKIKFMIHMHMSYSQLLDLNKLPAHNSY
jgi:hypothetical protein